MSDLPQKSSLYVLFWPIYSEYQISEAAILFFWILWKMLKDAKVAYDGFVFSRVPATRISNKMLYVL